MPSNVEVESESGNEPGINHPEIVAEVRAAFLMYESALLANDVKTLNEFFWHSPQAVRYGLAEHSYGAAAIHAYRERAPAVSPMRQLSHTIIISCGRNAASVATEFSLPSSEFVGRQTQTWMRFHNGWKIVAAHVSAIQRSTLER